ncbi:LAMI_0F11144g1_1 [Lachancea mirantina]|uniref:LAMI_0F11144g1_1 n=1 Tax=Lachancea mirantina TaxID=1230905 RepID=A0A1G4K290_9SACH|nr:LAMI_0F11144g1_1 [Lachancea mirantina]
MDTILLNAQQIDEHHIFYLMDENLVLRRNLMGFEVEILIDQFLAHLFRIRQASNYQQDMVDAEAASFQSAMDIRIQALCGVHGGDSVALWNLSKNGSETEDFELLQDSENFSEKLQTGIKSRRATWARYFMKRTFLESPKTQPEMASLHLKIRDLSHQSRTQKSKLEAPGSKNQSRYISSVLRTLKKKSILIAFVSFAITAALVTKFSPFSGLLYRLFVSANIYPDLSDGGPFQDNILLEDEDFESCTLYNLSSEIPHGNLSFKEMTAFVVSAPHA